jgi:hypothetical protein
MEMVQHMLNLPVAFQKDVVVVGGGCAGVVAALAAARTGADTLLIERASYLGGMLTGGLVHSLHGYKLHKNYSDGRPMDNWSTELLVRGISLEILNRLQAAGGTINHDHIGNPSVRENFDEEVMICVLDEMMMEAGIEVLFNTIAFAALKEGNAVQGVFIANKSGAQIVRAKMTIDASADADIAVNAGASFEFGTGDANGNRTHGAAIYMEIGGIDVDKLLKYMKNKPEMTEEQKAILKKDKMELLTGGEPSPDTILSLDGKHGPFSMAGKPQSWESIDQARAEGRYLILPRLDAEWIEYIKAHPEIPYMINTKTKKPTYPPPPRFTWFGLARLGKIRYDQTMTGLHEMFVDQSNELALSKAIQLMRKIDWLYIDFFRNHIPGFENAYIIKTAPMVGTRESRRIIGEYMLTAKDCISGAQFDDAVALCGRACNVHNHDGQDCIWYWLEPNGPYAIPYRCLLPKGIDNLFVAGRCSSVDFIALGATRSMPTCMSMGEASGTAAALAAKNNVRPIDLDINLLQKKLQELGVMLPEKAAK